MSSEQLGAAQNVLKGNLGGAWDITNGYQDAYTDLGIARRFGGSAAAYSLRDIGAMNGRVVKVRRDLAGEEADAEEDFSASQVDSGALENWVNGKLESTLPADVATAAAAYSLRKVKASYASNAVRIRRGSDEAEVNVAFDSNDKVSTSSDISVVSGSTTATDLNGFLNEIVSGFIATSYAGIDASYKNFTSDPTISNTAFSGANGGTQSRLTYQNPFGYLVSASDFDGCKVKVTGTVNTLSGGNITVKPNTQSNGGGSWTPSEGTKVLSTIGSFEYIFTGNGTNSFKSVVFLIDASTTVDVSNLTFEVIEHGATVHTWYDQAGSNNAVQTTAANQPKIAENGALLADGLDFDGSNDEMVLTSALGATTVQSIFAVQKNDITSGGSLLFDNRDANDDGSALFATDSAGNKQASWDATDAEHTATTNEELIGLIKTSSAITILANGVQRGSTSSSSTIDISTVPKIGQGSFGSSGTNYDGSIKEIICYNSDQSNNRFRIESNINNYYGLYNDANEFASDETAFRFLGQRSGGTSTSSDLTKFTLDVQTASGYAGAKLSADVVSSDVIYVSFNASLDEGSATASPKVGLRDIDSVLNGTVYSNEGVITEGFNSFALTSTNSNASGIVWSEGDDNVIFTISDIKVSRIERNGFVPTWYDQSTSGNNAVQATASNQPSIVQNGGICKSNGSPSLFFTGDTRDDELDFTDLTLTDAAIFTVVNIDSSADQQILLGGGSVGTSTGTMIPMMDNGSSNTQVYKNSTVGGAEQGSSQFKNGSAVTLADRDDAFDNLAVDSQILFTMIDVDVAEAKVLDGISRPPTDALGFHLQGQLNELIIYNSNLSSDRGDIEAEIANHYSITLS